MSVNMPIVKIATPQQAGVIPPVPNGERSYNNSENPSFGIKVINSESKLAQNIDWLGDDFTPAGQRLVSGVTGLLTQPIIDWNNKKTDEETRKASCSRILGKIIAGTLTGVLIRKGCINVTKLFTQNEDIYKYEKGKFLEKHNGDGKIFKDMPDFKTQKWKQWLLPADKINASAREIKKYRSALGTFAAIVIMIGTNFLIDVPLTTVLTNFFNKQFHKNNKINQPQTGEGGKQ